MKQRILRSITVSLEWRVIAFIITNLFLWISTGKLFEATILALQLQLILLVVNVCWFYFRYEGRRSPETVRILDENSA